MNINGRRTITIVATIVATTTTYVNVQLRGEVGDHKRLNASLAFEIDKRREALVDDSISHSLEGLRVPLDEIVGRENRDVWRSAAFYFVILEAQKACTPCFEMAINKLDGNIMEQPVVILSHRAHIMARSQGGNTTHNRILREDSTGWLHKKLKIPETITVCLLAEKSGRILYARVVNSQYPHPFDLFLGRVQRLLSG